MKRCAIIVAAGKSVRFGGETPKQFCELAGRPLLAWTISRFEKARSIDSIVVVVDGAWLRHTVEQVINPFRFTKITGVVTGGHSRQESVKNGLIKVADTAKYVAIHDGARPLVSPDDIDRTVDAAIMHEAAMLAARTTDTIKRVEAGRIVATLDRTVLYQAQTPQVFRYEIIKNAHDASKPEDVTDDSYLVERRGIAVHIVEPTGPNIKVTMPADFIMAGALLEAEQDD
jgi:2-C-methyl-D-erythritol 4-phosphate cytidylyltransferase